VSPDSLSNNEIDALLGGEPAAPASGNAPVVPAPSTTNEASVYDFRRPHRVPRDRLRSLDAVYERFAKSLESWLLNRVRGGVQLRLQKVDQLTFGEFTHSLPTPCAAFTFEAKETGGQLGVIDFPYDFAFFLVDRLFGGSGTPSMPARSLTPIERMAVRVVAERGLISLRDAWKDSLELDFGLAGFESIPEILRIANREDPVLVAGIEVTTGETTCLLSVCLPFTMIEGCLSPTKEERVAVLGTPAELAQNREMAEHSIRGSRMWVSARLPEFRISMRELLGLTNDSVLSTGLPRQVPLDILVGKQRRFQATPGRVGPALAVRLTDGLMPAPETDTIPLHRA
jgi:flagellar motor switch protein FliM